MTISPDQADATGRANRCYQQTSDTEDLRSIRERACLSPGQTQGQRQKTESGNR